MFLKDNAFYIAGVKVTDNRRTITAKSDELEFLMDSETASEAINTVINPVKRLNAELSWFVYADESAVATIKDCIEANQDIPTWNLKSIDMINAILFNFEKAASIDATSLKAIITLLDENYSNIHVSKLTSKINEIRDKAGFNTCSEGEVGEALAKHRDTVRRIVSEKLNSFNEKTYVELVTSLADQYNEIILNRDSVVIRDIIDQYEVKMQSKVDDMAAEIIKKIKDVSDNKSTDTKAAVEQIISDLKEWDKYAQPLQVKAMADGSTHEKSKELANEMFKFTLVLNNTKNSTEEALLVTKAMKEVFKELTEQIGGIEAADKKLEEIADERKKQQEEVENKRWANEEYVVSFNGQGFSVPNFCTCCMEQTDNRKKLSHFSIIGISHKRKVTTTTSRTTTVEMPVCPDCIKHQNQSVEYTDKGVVLSIISACILFAVLYIAGVPGIVSWLLSCPVLIGVYYYVGNKTILPEMDKKHSARGDAVSMVDTFTPNGNGIGFKFSNWEYANLFYQANLANGSTMTTKPSICTAKSEKLIKVRDKSEIKSHMKTGVFALTAVAFMFALLIGNIRESKRVENAPLNTSSSVATSTAAAPATNTNKATAPSSSSSSSATTQTTPTMPGANISQDSLTAINNYQMELLESEINELRAQIEKYEAELKTLDEKLVKTEESYNNTGDEKYADEYMELYEKFENLYEKYEAAVEEHNKKVEVWNSRYANK